jgi:hypothetical protein
MYFPLPAERGGGADAAAEEGGSARGRELRTKGREAEAQALLAPPPPSLPLVLTGHVSSLLPY